MQLTLCVSQAFSILLLLISIDSVKKTSLLIWKVSVQVQGNKHRFKGTRHKIKRCATESSAAATPNPGVHDTFDSSELPRHSKLIDSICEFVSASEKLKILKNNEEVANSAKSAT